MEEEIRPKEEEEWVHLTGFQVDGVEIEEKEGTEQGLSVGGKMHPCM